jgi:hypothetical protein
MNKKKIFGSLAILAIAAMAAINVSVNTREDGLSDVALNNVEALATETIPTPGYSSVTCKWVYPNGIDSGFRQCTCIGGGNILSCI